MTQLTASPPALRNSRRRDRLQQYQLQLLERMAAAKTSVTAPSKALGVLLGERRCLLDLRQIGEIMPLAGRAISPVPLVQNWYLGLSNMRGKLTGVIDLALYLGAPAMLPGPHSHVVTFAPALGFPCALLVTQVLGLHDISAMVCAPALPAAPAWLAQQLPAAAEAPWSRIDLTLLVREARFLQLAR